MELKKFENIVTSQWGEDGIINEIFNRIGEGNKICIEFGAWDGKHLSNCWNLWHNLDWTAILIEGEEDRTETLRKSLTKYPKVSAINKFVSIEGENSLDSILDSVDLNDTVDLLSIDIDSDDYMIFAGLKRNPRVVVIEYNPTIPPHIDLVQKPGFNLGNSVSSTYKLAKKKGYKLAYMTYTNLILVREEEWEKLNIEEVDYFRAFQYDKLTCVINTYAGDTILSQPIPYNGGYIEDANVGIKQSIRTKYFNKATKIAPEFDTSGELVYCEVKRK
ncbi:MAG: hypothetical protein AB8B74_01940 [Crocinitomicaceae bacterium]